MNSELGGVLGDLRCAIRYLVRTPSFSLVAVATVAIGIGANSALFGFVHALVSRPPHGVPLSEQTVWVDNAGNVEELSYPDFEALRAAVSSTIELAAYTGTTLGLSIGDYPEPVEGQLVSAQYFELLGVGLITGRGFAAEDDFLGAAPVVVVGYRIWQDRLGGRSDVVGSTLTVNGYPFTVVGVAPRDFVGTDLTRPARVWVPISTQAITMPRQYDVLRSRHSPDFRVVGRLRPHVTPETADEVLDAASARIEAPDSDRLRKLRLSVAPLRGWIRWDSLGWVVPGLVVASIVTGLVLLLACTNIAALLLTRGLARTRELAIRLSLGASRWRVIRQLVVEGLVLFVASGVIAVLVGSGIASALQASVPGDLAPLSLSPDARGLIFALGLAVVTGLVFNVIPAAALVGAALGATIQRGSATDRAAQRIQRGLTAGQVSVCFVLLVTSYLFLERLNRGRDVHLGFDANDVLVVSFDLTARGLDREASAAFYRSLGTSVLDLPSVRGASGPSYAPFRPGAAVMSASLSGAPTSPIPVVTMGVASDFFRTLGIRVERGRPLNAADVELGAPVAVVSSSLAAQAWGDGEALGQELFLDRGDHDLAVEVVGVAADVVTGDVFDPSPRQVYLPYTRHYELPLTSLLVRVSGDLEQTAAAVRQLVREEDPGLSVLAAEPLRAALDRETRISGMIAFVLTGFGAFALLLSTLGLFGVVAFAVTRRTQEIAIRAAVGAQPSAVVGRFVRRGAVVAAMGLGVGLILAVAFARILRSVLDGIPALAPSILGVTSAVLGGVALLACWLPARRATRVDPMLVLKSD